MKKAIFGIFLAVFSLNASENLSELYTKAVEFENKGEFKKAFKILNK